MSSPDPFAPLSASSPTQRATLDRARRAATSDQPLVLVGATGTGKSRLARAIHAASGRPGDLVVVNCASLDAGLFEAELFGSERGSFTGALEDRVGLFEAADRGTLFLDEVADLALVVQPRLLLALDEGRIRRVGARHERQVDVRVIVASQWPLAELVEGGRFRRDLAFRLAGFTVELPTLAARGRGDILDLARSMLAVTRKADPKAPSRFSAEAEEALGAYTWPGNIRELEGAVRGACIQARGRGVLSAEDLALGGAPPSAGTPAAPIEELFLALARRGFEDPIAWARLLTAWAPGLPSGTFGRKDMISLMRAAWGHERTDNALGAEWQRRVRPALRATGLTVVDRRRERVLMERCAAVMGDLAEAPATAPTSAAGPVVTRGASGVTASLESGSPPRDALIGRRRERATLARWIASDGEDLITIRGVGGIGKTRLARAVSSRAAERFAGGAVFVDLSSCRDVEEVLTTVAATLGITLRGAAPAVDQIASALSRRAPTLIVLDNFEQVSEAAASCLERWRGAALEQRFLVTSRSALELSGERVFDLGGLALPIAGLTGDELRRCDSVALFLDAAERAAPGHPLQQELDAVAAVCRAVDGIPLAIELAAGRVGLLAPTELAERLDRKLSLLRSRSSHHPPRHRTMALAIEFSVELLSEPERAGFAELSVFEGGFDLALAEQTLGLEVEGLPVVDLLEALLARSLMRATRRPGGARFSSYELVHDAARAAFAARDPDRASRVCESHAQAIAARLVAKELAVFGAGGRHALDALEAEAANTVRAIEWALANDRPSIAARLLGGLGVLHRFRPRSSLSMVTRLEATLTALEATSEPNTFERVQLRSLLTREHARAHLGEADERAESLLVFARTSGCDESLLLAIERYALTFSHRRPGEILPLCEEALDIARRLGGGRWIARCQHNLADARRARGDLEESLEAYDAAARSNRASGNLYYLAANLNNRGLALWRAGRLEEALEGLGEAERLNVETGNDESRGLNLVNQSIIASTLGDPESAIRCAREAEGLLRRNGHAEALQKALFARGIAATEIDPGVAVGVFEELEAVARSRGFAAGVAGAIRCQAERLAYVGRRREALGRLSDAEGDSAAEAPGAGAERAALRALLLALEGDDAARAALPEEGHDTPYVLGALALVDALLETAGAIDDRRRAELDAILSRPELAYEWFLAKARARLEA